MTTLDRMILWLAVRRMLVFLGALFAVLVGGQAAYLTGQGAPPELMIDLVVPLMWFTLPLILPMGVAAACLHIAGAMHREAQFQALAAAGIGPLRVLRACAIPIAIAAITGGMLAHLVLPPAMARLHEGRSQLAGALVDMRVAQRRAFSLDRGSL